MLGCTVEYLTPYPTKSEQNLVMRSVALAQLKRHSDSHKVLHDCIEHNLKVVDHILKNFSEQSYSLRMVRLSLQVLPLFNSTNKTVRAYYNSPDFTQHARRLGELGSYARRHKIRLSFHAPFDYSLLNSDDQLEHTIRRINIDAQIVELMGYSNFLDVKITHHLIGTSRHISELSQILRRLSPAARNSFVLENDMMYGLDDLVDYYRDVPIVIDLHHHWLKTGEHLKLHDPRVLRVQDSWRGVRPVMHYSLSQEPLVILTENGMPSLKKSTRFTDVNLLKKHSKNFWCSAANIHALKFYPYFDIMCEAGDSFKASYELLKFGEMQCLEIDTSSFL